jgi:5,10-methylenetetrahydrofolate reductase
MATVLQKLAESNGRPLFLCDFSPTRGVDPALYDRVKNVGADFVIVAYSPGKSVRVDSTMAAHFIRQDGEHDAIFTLACRDMNRLALQNHLLGAHLLGLENLVVLKGEEFAEKDLALTKSVNDVTPTQLIRDIVGLNKGIDFRKRNLRAPTTFCIGASFDPGQSDIKAEANLAHQKVKAGSDFFITQVLYDPSLVKRFLEIYNDITGDEFPKPIFYGLQILEKEGIFFGDTPERITRELEQGRPGIEIAFEHLQNCRENGLTNFYLVPPILKGGRRNYEAARQLLEMFSEVSPRV